MRDLTKPDDRQRASSKADERAPAEGARAERTGSGSPGRTASRKAKPEATGGTAPEDASSEVPAGEEKEEEEEGEGRQAKAPWHFKFMVVGSVIYLGYRLYQGIAWLAHHV